MAMELRPLVSPSLPSPAIREVVLLRRSKEAVDQDTKERGIEFNDYLEAVDHEVYTEEEEVNVDIDFAMLRRTESNLLQATLAFPGIATDSLSLL